MVLARSLLLLSLCAALAPSYPRQPPPAQATAWSVEVVRFQYDDASGAPVRSNACTIRGGATPSIRCDDGLTALLDPVEAAWFRDAARAVDWRQTLPTRAGMGGWRVTRPGEGTLVFFDGTPPDRALDRLIREMQATLEVRRLNALGGRCAPDTYLDTCPAPRGYGLPVTVCGTPTCVPVHPTGASCRADWQCHGRCVPQPTDSGLTRVCAPR